MAKSKAPPRRGRPPRKKNKGGRPSHKPTPEFREMVRMLVVAGNYTHPQIAAVLRIAVRTLQKHYRDEIDIGKARVDAMVVQTAVQMAIGGGGQKDGAGRPIPPNWREAVPSMTLAYLTHRMNWKKPKEEVGLSGSDDREAPPIKIESLTDAQLEHLLERLQK